jgi:hypothetical protein
MIVIFKILALVAGIVVGTALMKYSFQLTQLFGHNSWAEKYLGDGGTYTMWKLLGIALIILAVIYAL